MEKIDLQYRVLGPLQTNVYFIINKETKETVIIDPADNADYIATQCRLRGYRPSAILLTHGHFDHMYGLPALKKQIDVPVYAPAEEARMLADPELNRSGVWASAMGVTPDILLADGEVITLAGVDIRVMYTPGHTSGGCCYYIESEKLLIAGDTLFLESFGRTDLETGSTAALIRSIRDRLFPLPDDVAVYPGHGDPTTIGHEKKYNPIRYYF